MATWSTTENISAYFVLFSALLTVVLVLSKLLHSLPALAAVLPEAGMILLVGMIAGFFVNLFVPPNEDVVVENDDAAGQDSVAQSLLSFSPEVFFIALLPPIIFNSGYHLRRELFFRHIVPIVLFAVVGTTISAFCVTFLLKGVTDLGLTGGFDPTVTELLTFGALISATDPVTTLTVMQAKRVDPQLFYLVFGESVLNDAVGLVLFKSFAKFVARDNGAGKVAVGMVEFIIGFCLDSLGSPILGLICGCGAALLFKHLDMRNTRLLELSIYVLIMYVPFLLAEILKLSGIVSILFTGMAARAYVVPNLSQATANNAEVLFRLAAHLAETAIFLELGLSVWTLTGSLNIKFILWAILACLVGRALNVFPITFLFNASLRTKQALDESLSQHDSSRRKSRGGGQHHHQVEMTEMLTSSDHHPSQQQDDHLPPIARKDSDVSHTTDVSTISMTPRTEQDLKISSNTATMLWFSGLRGAVAYACVRSFPDTFGHQREFIMTTMLIVLVTVFALGGTTGPMLKLLNIDMDVDENKYMEDWHQQRESAGLILQFEEFVQRHAVRHVELTDQSSEEPDRSGGTSSYHAHVEVTESEHLRNLDEMGYPRSRKRNSVFDYGGGGGDC